MQSSAEASSVNIVALEEAAQATWKHFKAQPVIGRLLKKGYRTGVVVGVIRIQNPQLRMWVAGGEPNPKKKLAYETFAGEKLTRLADHPKHHGSSATRDVGKERYSGAVRGNALLVSTSGLWPDDLDELFSAVFLVEIGDLTREEALALLAKLENKQRRLFGSFGFKDSTVSA